MKQYFREPINKSILAVGVLLVLALTTVAACDYYSKPAELTNYAHNILLYEDFVESNKQPVDDTELFEGFITWVTDNQGAALYDFDMTYTFRFDDIEDVIVQLKVKKGDVID